MGKSKKFYEVVSEGLRLRSSPDVSDETDNVIQQFSAGLIVERISKEVTTVALGEERFDFIKVRISKDPDVEGFMALVHKRADGSVVEYFLLRTPLARLVEEELD